MGDSLGEYFQRAREAKGLTLEEAAARTRILPQYLKAVEENNYARLPDEVFAKGFVRSYARILGLNEDAVIRKFDESGGQFYAKRAERETLRQQIEEEERRKKVNRNLVVGVVGVALLLLFVLIGRDRDRSERLPDSEPIPPASQQVPAPTSPPAEPAEPVNEPAPRSSPGPLEVERNFSGALPLEGVAPDDRKKMVLDVEAVERCWVKVQTDRSAPVEGHAGDLVIDTAWGPLTAILQGRAHRYEGWSLEEVTFPVRVLAAWGVKTLVITNASGGLEGVEPGEVVLIADHLNLMGDNPLIGIGASERRFVEMVDAYDPGLLQLAEDVARKNGRLLKRVTLAAVTGPTYETPAEAQMLRVLGAHVVCMSMVPEVTVARSLGLRVLGLSLVTNVAGRPGPGGKTHEAVVAMGLQQAQLMERLLRDIISRL